MFGTSLSTIHSIATEGAFIGVNTGTWIAIVTLLVAAAALVGASFKNARDKATLSNLKDASDSWKARSEAQSLEIHDLQVENIGKEKRIAALEAKIELLEGLVTNRAKVEDLTRLLTESSAASLNKLTEILQQINNVRTDVHRIVGTTGSTP